MNEYSVGEIIIDKRGRTGLIVACYDLHFAVYYDVVIDGQTFQLQAEDIAKRA